MRLIKRFIASFLIVPFLMAMIPSAPAAEFSAMMPQPGAMVSLSPAFNPAVLKGVKVYANNPFKMDFILDKGDAASSPDQLKNESSRLVKYFLAALTTPEKDIWVNLSPYEKDRIVPDEFGQTDMGRDLLAQDYLLKQITSSVMYPEGAIGKKFWAKVYQAAFAKYGTTDIPVDTFNKVWIIPEYAKVYEHGDTAFVVKARLKVMLEQDYLALENNVAGKEKQPSNEVNAISSEVIREIVIPQLEKEVNEGSNFAPLRQVYYSLILSLWFKKRMKDSILGRKYMDQNKVTGIDIDDKDAKQKIYEQYVQAFKKGVYNYIKEENDPLTNELIPRKYFSGGFSGAQASQRVAFSQKWDYSEKTPLSNGFATVMVNLDNSGTTQLNSAVINDLELRKERLSAYSMFLSIDKELKELMNQSLVTDRGAENTNISNYRADIRRTLARMENMLNLMAEKLSIQEGVPSDIQNAVRQRAKQIAEQAGPNTYNYAKIKEWYQQSVNGLSTTYLDEVNYEIVGWVDLNNNFVRMANMTTTISELLNLMHRYALVNNKILDNLTIWDHFQPEDGDGEIKAVGQSTSVAKNIFNELQRIFKILGDSSSPEYARYSKLWPGSLPAVVGMIPLILTP